MKKFYFFIIIAISTSNLFGQWELIIDYGESISNFESIQFTESGKGMIVGYESDTASLGAYVIRSYNYGTTWDTALYYPQYSIFCDLEIINDSTVFVVGALNATNTIIAKTTDFGNTWDTTLFSFSTFAMKTIEFPSDSIGYIGCVYGLYKTYDAGNTWNLIDTVTSFQYERLKFINDTIGYIGPYLKTINGGYTWFQYMPFSCSGCKTSYISDSIGFACEWTGDSLITYKTNDAGSSWDIISVRYGFMPLEVLYFINDSIGYCGGNWFSQKTTDGGLTWVNQTPATDKIREFYFLNLDTGYVISDNFGMLWRTMDGGETFIEKNNSIQKLNIYPNPTTGLISITNEGLQITDLEVFDIYGKEVYVNRSLSLSKCEIDLSTQPKGIYIIKVTTSKGVAVEKVIKN